MQNHFNHALSSNFEWLEHILVKFAAHWGTAYSGGARGIGCSGSAIIGSPFTTYRTVEGFILIRRSGFMRHDLKQDPYALLPHVRIYAGGG